MEEAKLAQSLWQTVEDLTGQAPALGEKLQKCAGIIREKKLIPDPLLEEAVAALTDFREKLMAGEDLCRKLTLGKMPEAFDLALEESRKLKEKYALSVYREAFDRILSMTSTDEDALEKLQGIQQSIRAIDLDGSTEEDCGKLYSAYLDFDRLVTEQDDSARKAFMLSLIQADPSFFDAAYYAIRYLQIYCQKLLEAMRKADYAGCHELDSPPYQLSEDQIRKVLMNASFQKEVMEKSEISLRLGDDNYSIIALFMAWLYHQDPWKNSFSAKEIQSVGTGFGIRRISALPLEQLDALMQEMCELNVFRKSSREGTALAATASVRGWERRMPWRKAF